ncbi:DoxX family protein [Aureisphaera galaxeae]|uniref:DoxX family protein n=1 Tax=Aureisphaera galaxeae TaxID=1538023 RepID=UPI0023507605|nr:DoxX family protein [Aureisphaera galaxeae]MDC8005170.1 DoxX family protein [Aureisphaera galaxeae]
MKLQKTIYWIATVLLCGVMLYSASMYFTKTEMVKGFYERLGYPTYLVIPLAVAKVLGVIMVLWRKSKWLTEWAYAGFFFDLVLAFFAHYVLGDDVTFTLAAVVFLLLSYFFGKEVRH